MIEYIPQTGNAADHQTDSVSRFHTYNVVVVAATRYGPPFKK
jgi:hypothetical protein